MHNRFKRGLEAAPPVPSTSTGHDVLRLEKRVGGRECPEAVVANTRIRGYRTHQVHNTHPQSSHLGIPADVRQTNAFFQNAHGFNIGGNPSFHNHNQKIGRVTNFYGGGTDGLENLNGFVSFEAQYDSSAQDPDRQCHPGTRQYILKRLRDWIDNLDSTERIFWLYGPAGAGKSAIAQTIARSYARPKVAGTFFFRSDVNRSDGNRLFTTLAYQLSLSIPAIRDHIAHSLYKRPDLPRTDVETQFKQLLAWPFQILSDNAIQQLAPIIVIDGIDECNDENIQRRFLKVIDDAVTDDRFPLRFLIVSRPELHIEQTIRCFQTPILTTDLAKLDDTSQDIEKYLVNEFSRIASEQDLNPTWPGPEIIHDIVYKSSGNFILASIVIKFVGDPDNFAETQLDIVRNLKPPTTVSPFAPLDQLFLEILRRVPDQDFLKRYLAILTSRISESISKINRFLHEDDALLMGVSEKELHAKLRRMRSILKLEHQIDVHHRSFIDFLHNSSRSGQYYIKSSGVKRYLKLFIDALIRYISTLIEQPDSHSPPHFMPRFRDTIKDFPSKIELPADEWQDVIHPLLDLQDNLLQLPTFAPTRYCNECTVFHLLRELLHLGLHLGKFEGEPNGTAVQSVMNVRKRKGVISSNTTKKTENMSGNDLDNLLLSLFAQLPEITENWSPNTEVINLTKSILCFDYTETVTRVCFLSDAQKLVDLLVCIVHGNYAPPGINLDEMFKASMLALKIFARVPVLPLSFFLNGRNALCHYVWLNKPIPIQILSQTIFASRVLDPCYIVPMQCGDDTRKRIILFRGDVQGGGLSMVQWRQQLSGRPTTIIRIMLWLAKAIRYLHSLGVVLYRRFGLHDVFLDADLYPKLLCWCSTSQFFLDEQCKKWFSLEDNIFFFGCLFHELYSGVDVSLFSMEDRKHFMASRASVLEMPEYVWRLILRCCAPDPRSRPTMDDVIQEMESWEWETG